MLLNFRAFLRDSIAEMGLLACIWYSQALSPHSHGNYAHANVLYLLAVLH